MPFFSAEADGSGPEIPLGDELDVSGYSLGLDSTCNPSLFLDECCSVF